MPGMLAAFHWDPDPVAFVVPLLGRPVVWYGILYALGALVGYFITRHLVRLHLAEEGRGGAELGGLATRYTDWVLWVVVGGTLVGARLGNVFFYGWESYRQNPIDIIKVWEGGLSSHGSVIGGLIGLILVRILTRKRFPTIGFMRLLDMVVVTMAMVGCFIRVGNFVNQELVGTITQAPWAVVFGHPADGSVPLPRHPVQLYESLAYLVIFSILYTIWRSPMRRRFLGFTSGLFFILVFGSRFFLEYFKEHVHSILSSGGGLQMGQILSIPLIALGVVLGLMSVVWNRRKRDQWA